jgi:putative FmdB family regulatory protein
MPIHDYKCPMCYRRREVFLKIADMGSTVYCNCGSAMNKQLSAPYIHGDYQPYESPVVPGKIIHGRRQHEEHLKETGCRILEPGESDAHRRGLQHENDKLDQQVGETVDALIATMPTDKRDKLAAEMEAGLDARIERSTPKFNNA